MARSKRARRYRVGHAVAKMTAMLRSPAMKPAEVPEGYREYLMKKGLLPRPRPTALELARGRRRPQASWEDERVLTDALFSGRRFA